MGDTKETKLPISAPDADDPCLELKELYTAATSMSVAADADAAAGAAAATAAGQPGGYLNIDGEDYYLVRNNAPLNLNGGRLRNNEPVDMLTAEQDELLYKSKYLKYRAKYLALKRK